MNNTTAVVLNVGPSPNFPRRLWISWTPLSVAVALYPENALASRLVFAYVFRPDVALHPESDRIQLDLDKSVLWIGRTQFELSPAEVQQVREHFEPMGLAIKSGSPSPVAPSFETAHEAAQSIPLGERGMSPAVALEATPAPLELDNCTAARVLTEYEGF